MGTWTQFSVCNEKEMLLLSNTTGVKMEDLACISVNPSSAYRMLQDMVDLKEGDVVIQNGANSMVGICVIQMAKLRGIKTINIIRKQRPDFESLKSKLTAIGANIVYGDDDVGKPEFKKLISTLSKKPKLALNCVGGNTVTEMARLMEKGGVIVTYGGMSMKPVTIPTGSFIFHDITTRGFWLSNWVKQNPDKRGEMFKEIIKMFKDKKLELWTEKAKLEDYKQAIKKTHLQRDKKIIFDLN